MENKIIAILFVIMAAFYVFLSIYYKKNGEDKAYYLSWLLPAIFWVASSIVFFVRAYHGV